MSLSKAVRVDSGPIGGDEVVTAVPTPFLYEYLYRSTMPFYSPCSADGTPAILSDFLSSSGTLSYEYHMCVCLLLASEPLSTLGLVARQVIGKHLGPLKHIGCRSKGHKVPCDTWVCLD